MGCLASKSRSGCGAARNPDRACAGTGSLLDASDSAAYVTCDERLPRRHGARVRVRSYFGFQMSPKRGDEQEGRPQPERSDAEFRVVEPFEPPSLAGRLRAYFLTGVIVTAPISITIFLVWQFLDFLDTHVAGLLPDRYNPETYLPFSLPGPGAVDHAGVSHPGRHAHRRPGRPHPGADGRAAALAHAGRAQRLRHAQADLRDGARPEVTLVSRGGPDRVPEARSRRDRLRHRADPWRDPGALRGGDGQRLPADHAQSDLGLPAVRPEERPDPSRHVGRGRDEDGDLRRDRDARRWRRSASRAVR